MEQKGHRAHRIDRAHTGREHRAGAAATCQSPRKHFRGTNNGLDGECGYGSGQVLDLGTFVCCLVDCVAVILLLEPWTCSDSEVPLMLVIDWCSRQWSIMPFRPGIWGQNLTDVVLQSDTSHKCPSCYTLNCQHRHEISYAIKYIMCNIYE